MTNLDIQNAYLGLDQVDKVYLGSDVIYELEPVEPTCYLGEWSFMAEEEIYNFSISNTGDTVWENGVNIGKLIGVYFDGSNEAIDMNITLSYNGNNTWHIEFSEDGGTGTTSCDLAEIENWYFENILIEYGNSDSQIAAGWNLLETNPADFQFYLNNSDDFDLPISTINPECPPSE